jgi:hypothetical protein
VHYAERAAANAAASGKLQIPTLPELLPSRCRGRLFDANPEVRGACGGLPPPQPWLSLSTKFGVLAVFTHRNCLSRSNRQNIRFPSTFGRSADEHTVFPRTEVSRSNRRSMGLVPDRAKWQHWCSRLPIVLTLSCKDRPPSRPPSGGAAAAATNTQRRERTAADVTTACSSEPPKAAPPPSQRSAVFVSL